MNEVLPLRETEREELLSWLADHELAHPDRWDKVIERDSQPACRLDAVLSRDREDIAAWRTKPVGERFPSSFSPCMRLFSGV